MKDQQIGELLLQLEAEMRRLQLWETQMPEVEALTSEEPFCIDKLDLSQWLQWIFIPKMLFLIENQKPLPEYCGISEVAEEAFQGMKQNMNGVIDLIGKIDGVICR